LHSGDIIIERWVPYGAQAKRRTIVQRAAAAQGYARPRNIIVVYEAVQARVVRQFQRLGVTQESPQAYLSRYGQSLLDAATLVQQARSAGVVEDIVS
jgi:ribosomal protein S19E (S16A)